MMSYKAYDIHNNTLGGPIMEERRKSPREECNVKALILFKNKEIEADLRNISTGGAFLNVAEQDNHKITSADVDQMVTFRLTNGKSHVSYKGTIGRYTETEDNKKYLAIYFSQRTLHAPI
jgi:hypothetical protein